MNEYSIINDFVIAHFDNDVLVNTITDVPTLDMDANKENIYPLVNIDLTSNDVQIDAVVLSYKITVVKIRDVYPNATDSKLRKDTNYQDNLNEAHTICAAFINRLKWIHNEGNIEIQELSTLTPLKNWRGGLDGFQFDVDLSTFNKG